MAMPISLIDYSLNKSFISNSLCENRLKPEMHCAGKCYLQKQLAKTSDNQSSQNHKTGIKILIIDFLEALNKPSFGYSGLQSAYSAQFHAQRITSQFPGNIFHPPIA